MALRFFNTLTQRVEDFVPLHPPRVGMYTCGPTVYNYAHIGNLRAFTFEDLLRRHLEYRGFEVTHVMNITDVEDKIIRALRETGKSLASLTEFYTQEFFRDLDTLQILRAHIIPRATECIPDIIALIEKLIAKKHAYVGDDGSIYYSVQSFKEYGKLSHFKLEELQLGKRVKHDEYAKDAVADFALWKAWDEADGEVAWESPWGRGRPGWHTECSAMSMKYLGESFDIHCAGEDLIFPHHEDEIAQSEGATGKPFVRYWLHNAHLLVEGKKMSKSLGNFYTLRDLLAKGYTGREIRYALVSVHYRLPLNFTFEGLTAARAALARLDAFLIKLTEIAGTAVPAKQTAPQGCAAVNKLVADFESALDDNLNISSALGTLFDFIRETNKRIDSGDLSAPEATRMLDAWQKLDSILGLGFPQAKAPTEICQLLAVREEARKVNDFKRADQVRAELKAKGWLIEDTPSGPRLRKAC